jgi:hypothetical protein
MTHYYDLPILNSLKEELSKAGIVMIYNHGGDNSIINFIYLHPSPEGPNIVRRYIAAKSTVLWHCYKDGAEVYAHSILLEFLF